MLCISQTPFVCVLAFHAIAFDTVRLFHVHGMRLYMHLDMHLQVLDAYPLCVACVNTAEQWQEHRKSIHGKYTEKNNKHIIKVCVCVCVFCVRCSVGVNVHYTIREHLDVRNGKAWRQGFLFDWRQTKVKIYEDSEVCVCKLLNRSKVNRVEFSNYMILL